MLWNILAIKCPRLLGKRFFLFRRQSYKRDFILKITLLVLNTLVVFREDDMFTPFVVKHFNLNTVPVCNLYVLELM